MNNEDTVQQLLRWRQAQAEAAAPPAPRAARLLARSQPWWETSPGHFGALVERLCQIQLTYGHAMEHRLPGHGGHLVPAVIVRPQTEQEIFAQLLYFSVRDGRLRLRFRFEAGSDPGDTDYEVTFVSTVDRLPLFTGRAARSVEQEYRLEVELTGELEAGWARLKVTDDMPYRFIFRPIAAGGETA